MDTIGLWQIGESGPTRLQAAEVAAERDLEEWIERDPALLERGLVIVGRQIRLEGGPLDLLALDPQGQWVLIEIKRERLRRDVIAQAIDYASCLDQLDPSRLREQCDTYLRSKGRSETLDGLLEQRGRSLDDEAEGRDVVIYLVGTGIDPGLDRMVGFLAVRAELSVRMVTFSPFKDAQGKILLAREIHESTNEPRTGSATTGRTGSTVDSVLAMADQNGVGVVVRHLNALAQELGFYVKPCPKSIMIAPMANRTRCLIYVSADSQRNAPGVARTYIAAEAFEQFFGIKEVDLQEAVGPIARVMLDQAGANLLAVGL